MSAERGDKWKLFDLRGELGWEITLIENSLKIGKLGSCSWFLRKLDQNNSKMMTLVSKWSPTNGKLENNKNWNDITNYAKFEIAIIFLFAKFAKCGDLCEPFNPAMFMDRIRWGRQWGGEGGGGFKVNIHHISKFSVVMVWYLNLYQVCQRIFFVASFFMF